MSYAFNPLSGKFDVVVDDHTKLKNIGTNTHAQIDSKLHTAGTDTTMGTLTADMNFGGYKAVNQGQIMCKALRSGALTVTNNAYATVSFTTESFDTDNMIDIVGQPTRVTVNTAGKYMYQVWMSWAANATGYRAFKLIRNGSGTMATVVELNLGASYVRELNRIVIVDLVATDYIELQVFQDSGGDLTVSAAQLILWKIA